MSEAIIKSNEQLVIDRLGLFLVLVGSGLLAVWAMQHTIALRNILLGSGALLSFAYLYLNKDWRNSKADFSSMLPLIFIGIFFAWVVVHFLLFSGGESGQLKELRSTWLRAFLGVILGVTVGITISHYPKRIYLLGVGLWGAFTMLFYQYLLKISVNHQIFQIDFHSYIFAGKINGVLMGTLMIAAAGGILVDQLRSASSNLSWSKSSTICLLSITAPLYAYVFIFDSRNGITLAFILLLFWVIWGATSSLKYGVGFFSLSAQRRLLIFVIPLLVLGMFSLFTVVQLKHNPAWNHVIEDVMESYQIDKYPQWRDANFQGGYPVLSSGREITPNVFERVSWARAGIEAIIQEPWGNGMLQYSLQRTLQDLYPNINISNLPRSTHSAWIDLALSFGIPGVMCLLCSLGMTAYQVLRTRHENKGVVLSLSVAIFFIYLLGELSNKHTVEILLFMLALLSGLILVPVRQNR